MAEIIVGMIYGRILGVAWPILGLNPENTTQKFGWYQHIMMMYLLTGNIFYYVCIMHFVSAKEMKKILHNEIGNYFYVKDDYVGSPTVYM